MIPKLAAHRGYMQRYPENTLVGLEAAIDAGACFIEFDIQMTADEQFIVLHDSDFARTANNNASVFELDLLAAQKISVHEPDRFAEQYAGTTAPSLEQCLQLLQQHPKVTALVEIKEESLEHWGLQKVMDELFVSLKHHSEQCVIISFDYDAMIYTKNNSQFRTGWVLHKYDDEHKQNATKLVPDYLMCNYKKITEGKKPWPGHWQWMLYDIVDPELALRWCENGVGLIETCDIGMMLQHKKLAKESCHDQ